MIQSRQKLDCQVEGRVMTVGLRGEIDHHSAVELRRGLDELICTHRPSILRLDVSGIEFMDSSGLGLMMGRYALLKRLGGELILVSPGAAVLRMVRLAGMERIVRIEQAETTNKTE